MVPVETSRVLTRPAFLNDVEKLASYLKTLSAEKITGVMHVSEKLASEAARLIAAWGADGQQSAAIETFRGDIYSGLRALEFSEAEKAFAQKHLRLLSGLYGILLPYDGVAPYRLEAGYRLPDDPYKNLYTYWGEKLAGTLPAAGPIINLTSVEYQRLVLPYVDVSRVVTPRFLSRMNGSEPRFVVVHAKIARGAYARWLIKRGQASAKGLEKFNDLGYRYDPAQSTPSEPAYICDDFQGIGLSQRLA
jgi:cytoplasmic iron level regulating protein YaaA (DUF328/UPF0246 family)